MNTGIRWQGKKKAVTFSFDDGAVQDRRAVEILNRYGLKGTFHLNSALLGLPYTETFQGITVDRTRISPKEVRTLYHGHEVAAHTLTHPNLPELSDDTVIWQVEKDREILSDLCGYEVVGLAYPNGRYTDKTKKLVCEHTGIRYARTAAFTGNFMRPANVYEFAPTVYHYLHHMDGIATCFQKYLESDVPQPQVFCFFCHSYEMDFGISINWQTFEHFCKMVSGNPDIFYGTCSQILL